MKIGNTRVQGSFLADTWQRVYSNTLSSAATSITISDLDGNTAEEYILRIKIIGGADNYNPYLRINNDATTNIYGKQDLSGLNTTVAAERLTTDKIWIAVQTAPDTNDIVYCDFLIYAKSGYIRTIVQNVIEEITGNTITNIDFAAWVWNNSADNITSLVVLSNQTNGLGVGTIIELYAKRTKI